jgi:peptidoglycan hydrolase-like protein with peptidoglycan-binding domain
VAQSTFSKILSDAQARGKAPVKAPPSPAPVVPPPVQVPKGFKLVPAPVSQLQAIVTRLGFKKTKALSDGLYGKKTAAAWAAVAKKYGLDGTIQKVSGKTAKVNQETLVKLKAKAATPAKADLPKAPAAATKLIPVKTVQQGLNGKGVKPLLDVDGVWGDRTRNALNGWLRSQPGGAGVVYKLVGKNVRMPSAFAESLASAAKGAPAAPARVSVAVSTVKKGLSALGKVVGPGNTLDPKTRGVLDAFIKQMSYGVNTGYRVSKDGKTVLRLRKDVVQALQSAKPPVAQSAKPGEPPKPVPTPGPAPPPPPVVKKPEEDPIQRQAQAIVKAATVPTLVLTVQQGALATGKFPEVKATGKWDDTTHAALMEFMQMPQALRPIWAAAVPHMLSADEKIIKLIPNQSEAFGTAAKVYQERMAQERARREAEEAAKAAQGVSPLPPPEPSALPLMAPEEMPPQELSPDPITQQPTAPGPAPIPILEPVPSLPPAAAAAGAQAWVSAVAALKRFTELAPRYAKLVDAASTAEGGLKPGVAEAFEAWIASADRIKQRLAQLIEQDPKVRAAVDAAGPSVGLEGIFQLGGGYRRYFEGLGAAADTAVQLLREPFDAGGGVQGFASPVLWAARLGRLAGPAWAKLLELLGTRTVASIGGVATAAVGLETVINRDLQNFDELSKKVAELVASGGLTVEEGAQILDVAKPKKESIVGPLVVGGTLLGALALWLNREKK